MINDLILDLRTDTTIITAMAIQKLHPEWSLKEIFDKLNNEEEVQKLIEEFLVIPNKSL